MKITVLKNMHRKILVFLALTLLISCDPHNRTHKEFVWDDDVKELTGGNLYAWLQKAPFDNEFDRRRDDVVQITNAQQVFPFKGRYYNAIEELGRHLSGDTVVFQETEILFQDSVWGDLFLHATLLYDDQEVFLKDSYQEMGNPFFGGAEAVTDMHRSTLSETSVVAEHASYKTGIYWVWANYRQYLLGFYQRGQLVFETAVPLLGDTLATLDKLKEVNHSLGLHIPEWQNADVPDLREVKHAKSFWQDPFLGIYPGEFGNDVFVKAKDTPFVQDDSAHKGDYYFSHPSKGDVFFYTMMQQTELSKEDFNKANNKMAKYQYIGNDIYYEEHPEDGYVSGLAKAYFMGNRFMEIHYGYPEMDGEARQQVHDVLKHLKMLNFEG